jgi:hypothetical protein
MMMAIDDYSMHELLDRTSVILHTFEANVAEHPAADVYPEIKAQIEKTAEALVELYQMIGARHL